MSNWKDNFGMIVPMDICRHPDGTPISPVYPHKDKAIEYIRKNVGIDAYENMTGKEKEQVLNDWRKFDNINPKQEDNEQWAYM